MRRLRAEGIPELAGLVERCRAWNISHPVGVKVRYHPVIGRPEYRLRKTRGEAVVLSGHTACVFLEGESGCVALDAWPAGDCGDNMTVVRKLVILGVLLAALCRPADPPNEQLGALLDALNSKKNPCTDAEYRLALALRDVLAERGQRRLVICGVR